ncbi:hypothetical protein Q1H04_00015 [Francisella tularensis subsp. mediasiatica]|nr:hypothetical protein Q1H04_00015 [Francisella tularensis subsp. mediasiatica]
MWFIFTLSISIFAVFYALKIQKNPQSSTMYIYDNLYKNSDEHSLEQTQKMCIYS